jgi:regulator of sigma E protease
MAAFFETSFLFILVLGALIFVHELGHFLFAKRAGVRVERFSLGFGPSLFRKQWGETEYRVSIVPLGGYVKMYGENPDEEMSDPRGSFFHQSVWTRIPIVAAGPLFNLLFAILLVAMIHVLGLPVETSVEISRVLDGSAAAQAGVRAGDVVLSLNGQRIERLHDLKTKITEGAGRTLHLQVRRDTQSLTLPVMPILDSVTQEWRIGVELRPGEITLQRSNPFVALNQGVAWTWHITRLSVLGFGKMLSGAIPVSESLAGPLGIARELGRQAQGDGGWRNVAFFTAAISVSLAILNLLPIPVLDGGHLFFFAIEIVNGKPLSLRKREIAQQVGLLILVGLMLFAFYNDVMQMFIQK